MSRTFSLLLVGVLLATAHPTWALTGHVSAKDQFEYSFSSETQREIFENWLDVSYYFDSFRTGLMVNAQQPSEEGHRTIGVRHRFFEYPSGKFQLRVGHFYGLFGRGLIFSAYEDRFIRVDTVLDGIIGSTSLGRFNGTVFSGTPLARDLDIRGADLGYDIGRGWLVAGTGLTYQAPGPVQPGGKVNREWVAGGRVEKFFSFGDLYGEYGWKKGYDAELTPDNEFQNGRALYGACNLYVGPVSLALEGKDYERFVVVPRADGRVALNNPPSLTREHLYTLPRRKTPMLDPDDEVGFQAELNLAAPGGWSILANANHSEKHDGTLLYEEAYAHLEHDSLGPVYLRLAGSYQDATHEQLGLNQTGIADLTVFFASVYSLNLQVEHQHVRLQSQELPTSILHRGAFDIQLFTLEFAVAPAWTFAAVLERNNKQLPEQAIADGEKEGPFPAVTVSYATPGGGTFTVWGGKRQAGQVCTGGVCKFEPAFEGLEIFGIFRY
jgi:hypothetical protein